MIFFLKLLFLSQLIAEEELGTVDVIGSSPLPGIMIDRKNVPNIMPVVIGFFNTLIVFFPCLEPLFGPLL